MTNKRINTATDIKRILAEQVNLLRNKDGEELEKADLERARAIGYLCGIALTAIRDGELEKRLEAIEKAMKGE